MRILVAFGSKRGGTKELAEVIGQALTEAGHRVDVRTAASVDGLENWDAVVVGGGLYASLWHRQARRFVQRHVDELRRRPVWFFSSGPLDDSAKNGDLPPTAQVSKLLALVHARSHITLGGRLQPQAQGIIAQAMVKRGHAGDWRDLEQARVWARSVALELSNVSSCAISTKGWRVPRKLIRWMLGLLCLFTGLTAVFGGTQLLGWTPPIASFRPPRSMLEYTPFHSFIVPGLLLFFVIGFSNLLAGIQVLRQDRWGEIAAGFAGGAVTIWIITEMVLLHSFEWLQGFYLGIGLATLAAAIGLWKRRHY